MLNQDDERDEGRDEDGDDADDTEEDEDSEEGDEGDEDEGDEGDESDDADDDEESEEDDEKPLSASERKAFRAFMKKNKGQNRNNANRRVNSQRDRGGNKDRKDRQNDRRPNSQSSDTDKRLQNVEKFQKNSELLEKKRDFGFEHSLSPKQVDHVFKLTNRPTKKFLEQPHVKAALDAIGQQSNVRDNTPSSGGRGFKSAAGKSWEKMDDKEKRENFGDRRRSILASKRR